MLHVFRVGPLPIAGGEPAFLYCAAGEAGVFPELEPTDDLGLQRLGERHRGTKLLCEPELSHAAAKRKLACAPLPPWVRQIKAELTLRTLHGPSLAAEVSPDLLAAFMEAASTFLRLTPWERFEPDEPLVLQSSGGPIDLKEACVMGHGGEPGLSLYFASGTVAYLAASSTGRSKPKLTKLNGLAVLFETGVDSAVRVFREHYGIEAVPFLTRLERGKPGSVGPVEVVAAIAGLRAVSALASGGPSGRGHFQGAGVEMTVQAHRGDGDPVAAPAILDPEPVRMRAERNDPCPCGSGKKFKKCHLTSEPTPERQAPSQLETPHERDRRWTDQLTDYAHRRFGKGRFQAHVQAPFGSRPPDPGLAGLLALYETPIEGAPVARHFLGERGADLSASDRAWLELQLKTRLGLWEVLRVQPGEGLHAMELLTGETAFVTERLGSQALRPRGVLLAREVATDAGNVFCGTHQRPLGPEAAYPVFLAAREGSRPLLSLWEEGVATWEAQHTVAGTLKNTDEEDVAFIEQTFRLKAGAWQHALARLLATEGARLTEETATKAELALTRKGNRHHRSWENTCLASLTLTKTRIRVLTNSQPRAERARAWVEQALGGDARFFEQTSTPPPPVPGEGVLVDTQCVDGGADLQDVRAQMDRDWLSSPVPALAGKTPLQAMTTSEGREAVHWLLKNVEFSHPDEGGTGLAGHVLRRTLGLTETGQPLPHHELHLAVGAGRKASETLLDFARPLFAAMKPKAVAVYRIALELAEETWNAVVEADFHQDPVPLGELRLHHARSSLDPIVAETLEKLIERKRELFRSDQRLLHVQRLSKTSGNLSVAVEVRLETELADKLRALDIRP